MKKLTLLIALLLLCLCSCKKADNKSEETTTELKTEIKTELETELKTEYTMQEIENEFNKLEELIKDEIEYLTNDEITEKADELLEKYLPQTNLPINQTIKLRGKFNYCFYSDGSWMVSITAKAVTDETDYSDIILLYCEFETSDVTLLNENENILIEGTFDKSGKMRDCILLSPEITHITYKNNISQIMDDISNNAIIDYKNYDVYWHEDTTVFGNVYNVLDIKSEDAKLNFLEIFPCDIYDSETLFNTYVENYDYIIILQDKNKDKFVFIFSDFPVNSSKIAIETTLWADFYADNSIIIYGSYINGKLYQYSK